MANLSYIEEYLKGLEEEQMDAADFSHADPLSGEEGKPKPYKPGYGYDLYRSAQRFGQSADKAISAGLKGLAGTPRDLMGAAGGALQYLATPGETSYPVGPLAGIEKLVDTLGYQYGQPARDYGAQLAEEAARSRSEEIAQYEQNSPEYYAYQIGSSTGNMLPAIAVSFATKNPSLGAALMGGQAASSKYDQSIREGRTHEQASVDGTAFGLSELLTERIPLGFLTTQGGRLVWRTAKAGAAEAIQEPINGVIQNLYDIGVLNKDMSIDEILQQMKESSIIGGGTGSILAALTQLLVNQRRAPSFAPRDIPPEPDITQEQTPSVAPIAPGELSDMIVASQAPDDPSRRRFLQDMRDVATVAATTPADLLPGVPEITQQVEPQAPLPAPSIGVDFKNAPLPSRYNFVVNGKDLFVDAPDSADVRNGNLSVVIEESGEQVDITPYLDLSKDISQKDIDNAVASAVKDNFISRDDNVSFKGAERDYEEAGNNAQPATPGEIERFESQNNAQAEFDKVFGVTRELPRAEQPVSMDRDLTAQIPELTELTSQLSAARDRLKSLEAGIAPEGFEDVYTEQDIKDDIRLEKESIKLLEEEIAIKEQEPIEGEVSERTVESIDPFNMDQYYIAYDRDAPEIQLSKKSGKRDVSFSGKNYIEGLDLKKIIDKTNISGKVSGSGKINVKFVYVASGNNGRIIASDPSDALTTQTISAYGTARYAEPGLPYEVRINLAKFDENGIAEILDSQAERLGISVEELTSRGINKKN
jgi:hypothetical protein